MTGRALTPERFAQVLRLDELDKVPLNVRLARTQKKIEKGKGSLFAFELQMEIAHLGDRAAARKLGLSVRAIQRLRRKLPMARVELRGKLQP
jgi:hypothetical protein